jgi:fructan beta-fructosidase
MTLMRPHQRHLPSRGEAMRLTLSHRYLHLPVRDGAPKRRVRLLDGERVVYAFDVELAQGEPDFWVSADLAPWQGQELILDLNGDPAAPELELLVPSDQPAGAQDAYQEPLRPWFHFTSLRGWNNDPNGLLYFEGEYHLFYQHNPFGRRWGNMHWGHAVSGDLVHWQELGEALWPDEMGTMYSGSGVVDWDNTSGLGKDGQPPLICLYTVAGGRSPESQGQPFTQCLAYSNDRGRTWTKYAGNPVLAHVAGDNRDPKVIRHPQTGRWVMALYLEGNTYGIFSSEDLLSWREESRLEVEGGRECPDLFPLPLDGDPEQIKWVFWTAGGTYLVGDFDGRVFRPEGGVRHFCPGGDAYAAQTWSDAPGGRRLQIAWLRGDIPGTPFNQMMTFPVELELRAVGEGPRLFARPVREIALLYRESYSWPQWPLKELAAVNAALSAEAYHLRAKVDASGSWRIGLRGVPLAYDARTGEFSVGECRVPFAGTRPVTVEVLLDRTSLEVFVDEGRLYFALSQVFSPLEEVPLLEGEGEGRASLEAYELGPSWEGGQDLSACVHPR